MKPFPILRVRNNESVCIIILCVYTCKCCGVFFPHFCSYFISLKLPIRYCFPSRCPWKGEMSELMPGSLSCFFGKTRFPTRAVSSTCLAQAGDSLGAFIQQGWVLLSGVLFPSFPVADMAASSFLCVLWGENNQICRRNKRCVFKCLSDI